MQSCASEWVCPVGICSQLNRHHVKSYFLFTAAHACLHQAKNLTQNLSLTCLDLDRNEISDAGARLFAESLEEVQVLSSLHLNNNQISSTGAKDFATCLKVRHLVCVHSCQLHHMRFFIL